MSNNRHTPGPWYYHWDQTNNVVKKTIGDREYVIATVADWGEDNNAALIAAAPELLAVLEKIITTADHNGVSHLYENRQGNPRVPRCRFGDALAEGRAAIAKLRAV